MLDKTKIFLVRHGQTLWNTQNRLQGHKDSPLTEIGKQQAYQAKKNINPYEIQKAYVSPLQRAQDTLDIIIKDKDIEVVRSNKLKEINLGPWEGKTRRETAQSHPVEYNQFWKNQDRFALSGAETYRQLQNRVVEKLETIFTEDKGKNILVVSHWITIKVALAYYTSTPLSMLSGAPDPENGTLIVLTNQGNAISIREM